MFIVQLPDELLKHELHDLSKKSAPLVTCKLQTGICSLCVSLKVKCLS